MSSQTISITPKRRDSNMELLRIVSMLLVLVVHADYLSLGSPTPGDAVAHPTESIIKALVYSLSTVCVNCFVLLSGWYGIRPKLRRFAEFIFQILFICGVTMLGYLVITHSKPDTADIKSLLLLTDDLWFVRSYIILYLFAPALNAFSSWASHRQFIWVLTGLFLFQSIYGWAFVIVPWFDGGYSPLSFMLLYLLAQYIRRYPSKLTRLSSRWYLLLYLILTIFGGFISFFSLYYGIGEGMAWLSYISPIVILNSVVLLLFFSKLSLKSKAVNWIACSCFAVYLLHCTRHVLDAYCSHVREYYQAQHYEGIILLIVSVYVSAILLDKARIWVWHMVSQRNDNK